MKIQIVIPVYNDPIRPLRMIHHCYRQMKAVNDNPDLPDMAMMVVNDRSTDETEASLAAEIGAINDPAIQIISTDRRRFCGGARNAGVDATGSDYIMFFDADDDLAPLALETIASTIAKNESDMVMWGLQKLTRKGTEVFTPSWICNEQNNLVDEAWFGRKDKLFNKPNPDYKTGFDFGADYPQLRWKATYGRHSIPFLHNKKGRTWKDYVKALRLEVSCGEAPYLTSRYDTTTGKWIEPRSRIGLLDRKLRIVTEQCKNKGPEEWLKWAEVALQGCYGFEWQGDNVLLARENMLYAVIEYFCDVFKGRKFPPVAARRFAEIISWNIWQMDGIKFVVPNTCRGKKVETPNLDGTVEVRIKPCEGCDKGDVKKHDGVRCRVMDWETGKPVLFMPPFEFKPIEDVSEIIGGRNDIA